MKYEFITYKDSLRLWIDMRYFKVKSQLYLSLLLTFKKLLRLAKYDGNVLEHI